MMNRNKFQKKIFEQLPKKLSKCPKCEQHVMSLDNLLLSLNPFTSKSVRCAKCETHLRLNFYGVGEFFVIFYGYLFLINFILDSVGFFSLFEADELLEIFFHIFTALYLLGGIYLALFPARKYGRRLFIPN